MPSPSRVRCQLCRAASRSNPSIALDADPSLSCPDLSPAVTERSLTRPAEEVVVIEVRPGALTGRLRSRSGGSGQLNVVPFPTQSHTPRRSARAVSLREPLADDTRILSHVIEPLHEQLLLRLLEDKPTREKRLAVNNWEARLALKLTQIAEESDYFEHDYPERDGQYRHPLSDGGDFFTLTPPVRLDLVYALCENRLENSEECSAEVGAMAAVAAPTKDSHGHPECHGDAVGTDSDNRIYYVTGDDLRVYRWERPKGKGFTDPGWGTVCVGLQDAKAFAESFRKSKSPKEKQLFEYFTEMHLPTHIAAEEKKQKLERQRVAREEELEKRRRDKEAYDSLDRKKSGRIAIKLAEIAEERRIKAEAEEAEAMVEATVAKREEERQLACWRWMLLPPRLRPEEVPDGMDPSTSDAAVVAKKKREEAAAAAAAALAAETSEQRAAREARENPSGDAAVGRYLQIFWEEDDAWYDGLVEGYNAETGAHVVRYLLDSVTEEVEIAKEKKRWLEGPPAPTESPALPIPPPEPQEPGLEYRGVRVDGRSTTVLYLKQTKGEEGGVEEKEEEEEEEEEEEAAKMKALADDMGVAREDDVEVPSKRAKFGHEVANWVAAPLLEEVPPLGTNIL